MTNALRGCAGRVAVVECGDGALLARSGAHGCRRVRGRAARIGRRRRARRAASKCASTTAPRTCTPSAPPRWVGSCYAASSSARRSASCCCLIDAAAAKLAPGGRLVICSAAARSVGARRTGRRGRPRRRPPAPSRNLDDGPSRTGICRRADPHRPAPTPTSSPRPAPTNDRGSPVRPHARAARRGRAALPRGAGSAACRGLPLRHLLLRGQRRVQAPGRARSCRSTTRRPRDRPGCCTTRRSAHPSPTSSAPATSR